MLLAWSSVVESAGFEKSIVQTDATLTTIRDALRGFQTVYRNRGVREYRYRRILVHLNIYVADTVVVHHFYMTRSECIGSRFGSAFNRRQGT